MDTNALADLGCLHLQLHIPDVGTHQNQTTIVSMDGGIGEPRLQCFRAVKCLPETKGPSFVCHCGLDPS